MAITYTWKITGINTKNDTNNTVIVVQTRWEKIGTDENGNTGKFMGATPFDFNSAIQNPNLIPIDQLTEAQVISWIQAVAIGDYEIHINKVILDAINKKISPVIEASLPWAVVP
jgi:hypothetical protein